MGLSELARQTLEIVDSGGYVAPSGRRIDLSADVARAVAGTRLYRPDALAGLVGGPARAGGPARVEVTPESTAAAGRRLLAEGEPRVAVLNFASARNVGGGFLSGARAQEEELCRASALYRCLEGVPEYYDAHRDQRSALYTDHLIGTPEVPFFRDERRELVEEPYRLGVVTAPAPNTGAVRQNEPDAVGAIAATFVRRAAMVCAVAEDLGYDVLVLGAWGCGAFQGDPAMAADAFGAALEGRFAGSFRRVVFAVLVASGRDRRNLEAFQKRFPSAGTS